MPLDNPTIIAERSVPAGERRAWRAAFLLAVVIGGTAALVYAARGLTLSHYDARAHLVVARRILDSLMPGWMQIGAVWLPLPHVLNALPVQWDWAYRSGATAVGLSVGVLAWGLAAFAAFVHRQTGSTLAAIALPLALLLNPNVLYLQSTPMTEPLLIGLALVALDAVDRWRIAPDDRRAWRAAWALAALVLTRYEGWPIAAALVAIAMAAHGRAALRIAAGPVVAIGLFLLLSRGSTGAWFVASGFFVPDNPSAGQARLVLDDILESTVQLGGEPLVWAGAAGAIACLWRARRSIAALLPLACVSAGALPFAAFYAGHPHRVRYMVPLVAAAVVLSGAAIAAVPARGRGAAAVLLLGTGLWTRTPLDAGAPMVLEAQWETPWRLERREVTRVLAAVHDGTPILASMGSLAHYMQETAAAGFDLRDFLHEGNGDLWKVALLRPRRQVRWILIEERAEGGDLLARLAREDESFLDGFDRVTAHGGLALYRRRE